MFLLLPEIIKNGNLTKNETVVNVLRSTLPLDADKEAEIYVSLFEKFFQLPMH